MSTPQQRDPRGDLKTALEHAAHLLQQDAALAEAQAIEILKVFQGSVAALQILGTARRLQGRAEEALAAFEIGAEAAKDAAGFQYEYGLALGAAGRGGDAIAALRRAVKLKPDMPGAWRALGDQLLLAGDEAGSQKAYQRHLTTAVHNPRLVEAANLLYRGKLAETERLCRDVLKQHPTDVAAIRMLADVGMRLAKFEDAENLLARALELAPDYRLARGNYAITLHRRQKYELALEQLDVLLKRDPNDPNHLLLKASILVRIGRFDEAIVIYERVLKHYPDQPKAHMSYGHALRAVGRQEETIAAYRQAIRRQPSLGEAWWSLANLKTFRFTDADLETMQRQIERNAGDSEDRIHLNFALGKALEDRGDYDAAFAAYALGNAARRKTVPYNADENTSDKDRRIACLTAEFFEARAGQGCQRPDPIFIVGLPRAGSTLLEQILSSHSQVEGTMELPDIITIARRLAGKDKREDASDYPEILRELSPAQLSELGEEYLARTQVQRTGGTPFFIDKMPNNFSHIGLIHLILPNAKIIDARRHPLAGCFSGFKQLFARGQTYTYDLTDIGRYYRDYVELMDHWDRVLPGRVHRAQYEEIVADTEAQVRRLLDYCGLPFEEQCLRFYETERAVRTASSEQVRQPVYTDAVEHWRHFLPHLDPLIAALGPVMDRYPI